MVQSIGFVIAVVFFVALAFYTRYIFRRLGPPPGARSPRGWRLVLFWLVIVLTVAVIIPAIIVSVDYEFGQFDCPAPRSPGESFGCSAAGRATLLIGSLAIMLPLAALWLRFLHSWTARKYDV